jgi:Arc/MetJ family transcription regulator
MRTTIHIDDDALAEARAYAAARSIGIGKAISALVRKGARQRTPVKEVNGLRVFDLPPGTPSLTAERVKELLEEGG